MKQEWLVGTTMQGYGVTLTVGVGIPIPILNEEICQYTSVKDEEIWTQIVDYSEAYPQGIRESRGEINYAQLINGTIAIQGKEVPTGNLSSYPKAVEIANILKEWIKKGDFLLSEPATYLPGSETGYTVGPLKERSIEN